MAVPRPLLLALVGALLIGVAFYAIRSHSGGGSSTPVSQPAKPGKQRPSTTARAKPKPAQPAAAASVRSGKFAFNFAMTGLSDNGKAVAARQGISASGAFESRGPSVMPLFDLNVRVAEKGKVAQAGAVSLGSKGYLTSGRMGYAVPAAAWSKLQDLRRRLARYATKAPPSSTGPLPAMLGFESNAWFSGVHAAGADTIDGVRSTHYSGHADVPQMLRAVGSAASNAKLNSDLKGVTARYARVDAWVGSDHTLRRLEVRSAFNDANAKGARAHDYKHVRIAMSYRLSEANRPQHIGAPAVVRRSPAGAAAALGSTALGLGVVMIDEPGLAAARRAHFDFGSSVAGPGGRSQAATVARLVAQRRVVVLAFFQPGADDAADIAAIAEVRRRHLATVVVDRIGNIGRYGSLIQGIGIDRAPAIVIVDHRRRARLVEGYVDPETLAQEVSDARG